MKAKINPKLNKLQMAYCQAQARYELAHEIERRFDDKFNAAIDRDDEEEAERIAIEAARESGVDAAWVAFMICEEALLNWGAKVVQKRSPEYWQQVRPVFETRNIGIRAKVVDLTLRLNA